MGMRENRLVQHRVGNLLGGKLTPAAFAAWEYSPPGLHGDTETQQKVPHSIVEKVPPAAFAAWKSIQPGVRYWGGELHPMESHKEGRGEGTQATL